MMHSMVFKWSEYEDVTLSVNRKKKTKLYSYASAKYVELKGQ